MPPYKIYRYLNALTLDELSELKKFIMMNYSDKTEPSKVFSYLLEERRKWERETNKNEHGKNSTSKERTLYNDLTTQKIAIHLFKDNNAKRVSDAFSEITLQIENYLLYKTIRNDKDYSSITLAEELFSRKLTNDGNKKIKDLLKKFRNRRETEISSPLMIHKLFHLMYFSETSFKYNFHVELLDLSQKTIRIYNDLINQYYELSRKNIKKVKSITPKKKDISLNEIKQPFIAIDNLIIDINDLLKSIHAIEETDPNSSNLFLITYDKFISLPDIGRTELHAFIFMQLINVCSRLLKVGNSELSQHYLILYKFGLKKQLFTLKGSISATRFCNIIDLGCKLRNIEWAESIQEKYIQVVNSKHHLFAKKMSEIQIKFAKNQDCINKKEDSKHWNEVLKLGGINAVNDQLRNDLIEYSRYPRLPMNLKLRYKWYYFAVLYELDEYNIILNQHKVNLKNLDRTKSKMALGTYQGARKFYEFLYELVNTSDKVSPLKKLLKKIEKEQNLIFRIWLIDKLQLAIKKW